MHSIKRSIPYMLRLAHDGNILLLLVMYNEIDKNAILSYYIFIQIEVPMEREIFVFCIQ